MYKVELIHYFDVWGNPEEGFQVNNLCSEWTHEVDDLDDRTLFDLLHEKNFLRPDVDFEELEFEDLYPFIEFSVAENGCPIGRFVVLEE